MRPGYEFGQCEPGKPVGIESAAISDRNRAPPRRNEKFIELCSKLTFPGGLIVGEEY